MPRIDLAGQVYGRLTVKRFTRTRNSNAHWLCLCECSTEVEVAACHLKSGHTASCGCFHREVTGDTHRTHGEGRYGQITPEYRSWRGMLARCYSPSHNRYYRYGGRGIQVCPEWRNSYETFLLDMGRKPDRKLSLDRIDNDKNYGPENCRWATAKQQAANRGGIFKRKV